MYRLLLASQSPRRQELVSSLGFSFTAVSTGTEELYPQDLPAAEIAPYLSELKAREYGPLERGDLLLTADTVVVQKERILEKPLDAAHAQEMLLLLSGSSHQVYTSFTLRSTDTCSTYTDRATVHFDTFSPEEIQYYIARYKPFDKAGSYGIQEWLGMSKVTGIEGSFYTIMGLPTHLVYRHLSPYFPLG